MLQSADPAFLAPLATILADVDGDKRRIRSFELRLLEEVERHVGTVTPALLPVTPVVLKNLYDRDLLEEETILAWYDQPTLMHSTGARVRARAEPVVSWLRRATDDAIPDEHKVADDDDAADDLS
jgi:hypothetical protein